MHKKSIQEILATKPGKIPSVITTVVLVLAMLVVCAYFYAKSLPIYYPGWNYGYIICEGELPAEMKIIVEVGHVDDPEFIELVQLGRRRCR